MPGVVVMEILRNMSNRELAAYGALCLQAFCRAKQISHPYIDELLEQLLKKLISTNLVEWDRELAVLELSGAGDPIPEAVEVIAGNNLRDFHFFVEYAVEIAIGDMFAKPSDRPLNDLFRCLEILDANGIARPDVPGVFRNKVREEDTAPHTGEPCSQEEYEQVKSLIH